MKNAWNKILFTIATIKSKRVSSIYKGGWKNKAEEKNVVKKLEKRLYAKKYNFSKKSIAKA